jgi:hypothetical protein
MSAAHDWTTCHHCLGDLFRAHAVRVAVGDARVPMHAGCEAARRAQREALTPATAMDHPGWGSDATWPPSRVDRRINGEAR